MNRKGFIHIVEIIIISLLAFIVVLQFVGTPRLSPEWDKTKLFLQANDAFFSMNSMGVNWLNSSDLRERLEQYFSNSSIAYRIKIRNAVKPQITVGCLCSNADKAKLEGILRPFKVNGEEVRFVVEQIGDLSIEPPNIEFPFRHDVIFLWNTNLTDEHRDGIENYLKADKGIVEVKDLRSPELDFNEQRIQYDIFGIRDDTNVFSSGNNIKFSIYEQSKYYDIFTYFYSFPYFYDDFNDGDPNGWTLVDNPPAYWDVQENKLLLDAADTGIMIRSYGGEAWYDYRVEADINLELDYTGTSLGWGGIGARYSTGYYGDERYLLAVDFQGNVYLYNVTGNELKYIAGVATDVDLTKPVTLGLEVKGTRINVYVNRELKYTTTHDLLSFGKISLEAGSARVGFDDVKVKIPKPYTFSNFLLNEKANVTKEEIQRIILMQENSGAPALIVNDNDGRGRTAWLSGGDDALDSRKNLIRSLVAWAAGDSYEISNNIALQDPVTLSFLNVVNKDFYQPYYITMGLSYIY